MRHLPPKIILTAKAGVGLEKIRLLIGPHDSADAGLALLRSAMPSVNQLDRSIRGRSAGRSPGCAS